MSESTTTPLPEFRTPFENIALAFSGGGFRAATFSLGVLSYLEHITFTDHTDGGREKSLLKKVTYLSSASGGTIAAATYALFNVQGESFEEYYKTLYQVLKGDDLLGKALAMLNDKQCWKERPHKNRNLINAFAMAYDKYLFHGATVGSLMPGNDVRTHLAEVCFNTTEFFRGLLFKQQVKLQPDRDDPWFLYGNFIVKIDNEGVRKLKLGDLLATSSCFPAGFEPVIFPDDFSYNGVTPEYLSGELHFKKQTGDNTELMFMKSPKVGFMDGGITDNQGIESMMRADERRRRGSTDFKPFDLMLVNDVGSHFMDPYVEPTMLKKKFTSWSIRTWSIIIVLLLAAGLGGVSFILKQEPTLMERIAIIGGSMLTTASIAVGITLLVLRLKIIGKSHDASGMNPSQNFSRNILKTLLNYSTHTPIKVLWRMINSRVNSVLILNNDVFLKRIRKLLYDKFYGTPVWKNRGKGNHVYDLAFTNNINRTNPVSGVYPKHLEPSRDMQIVAETAYGMGTTLWFDSNGDKNQDCILACAQFTTCYNLLDYVERLENNVINDLDDGYRKRLADIKKQLQADYEHFKTDPFFLYNEYGKKAGTPTVSVRDIPFPEWFKDTGL